MIREYTCLSSECPRSFLFAVVANVGPRGASRSLAVAYRQGSDIVSQSPLTRVDQFVADTLALIEILSDPANRAPLEAERALAEDWYRRSDSRGGTTNNEAESSTSSSSERPSVPDTPQPAFVIPDGRHRVEQAQLLQPELPWHDDEALSEFPFTTTCLLLGLLRDNSNSDANANTTNNNRTRPGDVQLQPLSTVFRGDCIKYGLVILDISDLDSGVKYGVIAFPLRYMAEVYYNGPNHDWDPVEDDPPEKEPDVVLVSPRPRVPLSILQWVHKYFNYEDVRKDPSILRLEERPLVDAAALDYIWPPELEIQARASSQGVLSSISNYFWPSKPTTRAKDASTPTTTASRSTTPHKPPPNPQTDRAIDNLLLLTQDPIDLPLDKTTISNFQKLGEFREQLRLRLEEVPDSLGPSSEISGHILRVAVIAAAVASDELRGASALSLCVDKFRLEGEGCEGDKEDISDLLEVLAQSTALKQLCFLQGPDRDSDEASARFCTRLLLSSGDLGWLRDKTIYPTYAFSTSFISPSTTGIGFTSVFPAMHMFRFVGHRYEDVADAEQNNYSYSYYDMSNILLDAERFAVRFLSYLRSVGSGSDKAILRFASGGHSSSLTTTDDDNSPSGRFGVSPIPAGFFGNHLAARVRVRDIHPGSWVLLLGQRGRSSTDDENDDNVFLQYSFVRIRRPSAEIAPEKQQQQQQQQQRPVPDLVEVVGGLTEFLRETVSGIDISTYKKQIGEAERELRARRASISIDVMDESSARALLDQLL